MACQKLFSSSFYINVFKGRYVLWDRKKLLDFGTLERTTEEEFEHHPAFNHSPSFVYASFINIIRFLECFSFDASRLANEFTVDIFSQGGHLKCNLEFHPLTKPASRGNIARFLSKIISTFLIYVSLAHKFSSCSSNLCFDFFMLFCQSCYCHTVACFAFLFILQLVNVDFCPYSHKA